MYKSEQFFYKRFPFSSSFIYSRSSTVTAFSVAIHPVVVVVAVVVAAAVIGLFQRSKSVAPEFPFGEIVQLQARTAGVAGLRRYPLDRQGCSG